ncbi:MAG: DNA-binding protein [Alphaproteobacteria bacterium]|nr:MAG: DNA-binding protein [Alphaproteobacteria bacterium]
MIIQSPLPVTSDALLKNLQKLAVSYTLHKHEPVFTVEEGEHLKASISGLHCRNLFLRDKKKKMFLVVAANDTKIDLKKLSSLLDCARFSFGSADRLWENLGIRQGSVNPFCIMNDTDHKVRIILDKYMMDKDIVNYHPMDNAMTIGLSPSDLVRFINSTNHDPEIVDLAPAAPD